METTAPVHRTWTIRNDKFQKATMKHSLRARRDADPEKKTRRKAALRERTAESRTGATSGEDPIEDQVQDWDLYENNNMFILS